MSKVTREEKSPSAAAGSEAPISGTRIDAAHAAEVSSEKMAASSVPEELLAVISPATASDEPEEQLYRQATQLAEYLRTRQSGLDHREAQLNAHIAQLESDARTARLWLGEREVELRKRQGSLARGECELKRRLDRMAAIDAAHRSRQEEENARVRQATDRQAEAEQRLRAAVAAKEEAERQKREYQQRLHAWKEEEARLRAERETELQFRADALREKEEKLAGQADVPPAVPQERETHARSRLAALELREQELGAAEKRLAEAQEETSRLQDQLRAQREQFQEEARRQRQQIAATQRQALTEVEKKRQALQRRSAHLDHCHTAIVQLRGELQQMQRETLEIRLTTEELWVQLAGTAPPAALTRSLGRVRSQLADQYRLAGTEMLEQKKEIESIRKELAAQCEAFTTQKKQFEQWAAARQQQIEEQAERLVAREQDLDDQDTRLRDRAVHWETQRHEYEQTIRLLQLKRAEPAGAVPLSY